MQFCVDSILVHPGRSFMGKKVRKRIHSVTLREQIRREPGLFAVYILLRTSVILVMIAQILNKDWQNVMLCVFTLFLFTVPSFIEKNWHIDIPSTLEVIILLFIYSAEISGEIRSYYINIPGWDTVLHTITGFLSAAIGFSLVDIINRNERTKLYLSPLYVAIGAFCFSMTIGVLWEFFEFSMDWFFGLDMQKDTIINTINTVVLDPTRSNKVVTITGITSTCTPDFSSNTFPISSNAVWISALEFKSVMLVPSRDVSYSNVSMDVSMGTVFSSSFGSSGSLANPNRTPQPVSMVSIKAAAIPRVSTLDANRFFIVSPP